MELRSILEWEIAPRLRTVSGVIEVNAFGGELKTYEVQVRPEDLTRHDIALNDVVSALERNNANAGGAYIQRAGEQYLVRGEGLITTLEDISDIVVTKDEDGTPIYIRNLADVRFAPMVRQGAVTRDGRGEVVTGIAMMLMGANSRDGRHRAQGGGRAAAPEPRQARGRDRSVLRPHRARQEDDQHGRQEPDRGRPARDRRSCS